MNSRSSVPGSRTNSILESGGQRGLVEGSFFLSFFLLLLSLFLSFEWRKSARDHIEEDLGQKRSETLHTFPLIVACPFREKRAQGPTLPLCLRHHDVLRPPDSACLSRQDCESIRENFSWRVVCVYVYREYTDDPPNEEERGYARSKCVVVCHTLRVSASKRVCICDRGDTEALRVLSDFSPTSKPKSGYLETTRIKSPLYWDNWKKIFAKAVRLYGERLQVEMMK